jgi:hypothetical protein
LARSQQTSQPSTYEQRQRAKVRSGRRSTMDTDRDPRNGKRHGVSKETTRFMKVG